VKIVEDAGLVFQAENVVSVRLVSRYRYDRQQLNCDCPLVVPFEASWASQSDQRVGRDIRNHHQIGRLARLLEGQSFYLYCELVAGYYYYYHRRLLTAARLVACGLMWRQVLRLHDQQDWH
jgi:hypothetical protein